MFCAFEGPPKIVRLHGTGHVANAGTPKFEALHHLLPDLRPDGLPGLDPAIGV